MRSPLVYLTVVKLKNQLKEAVKHPAKLIYVVFLAAVLLLTVMGGRDADMELRPLYELTAIMVLFYSLMFLMTFINGLNGGAGNYPMFTLSDVSMLFPSPLKPNKVLFYGLTRQLGLSLLLGFFLLFQYSWLHSLYGLEYPHLILIVLGYGLCLFLGVRGPYLLILDTRTPDGLIDLFRGKVRLFKVKILLAYLVNDFLEMPMRISL